MNGTGVIDRFLDVFTRYIDSGFGLLGGEVAFLAATLIVIDITLAALFWAWGADDDIIARLIKKTLFVGVFAWIIGNWNFLAQVIFDSFAGLGLVASGSTITAQQLLQPGRVAQVGLDAGRPLLQAVSGLMGYISFFTNFVQIAILMFAWAVVLLSFFILAIQLFVTLIEFKLTTLAGFVLVPFGLFGKTAFLAERVLGNVVSSGVKVLVLAVIVGIGSTLFLQFTTGFGANQPTIDEAMSIVLAALALLALGIFGPGIANGLISGGPQLSAGAAVGTGLAVGGAAVAGVAAARTGMAAVGAAASAAGATARGAAYAAGATGTAYRSGGASGVVMAGASAAASPLRSAADSLRASHAAGSAAVSGGGQPSAPEPSGPAGGAPAWARRMRRGQALSHGVTTLGHAIRSGDGGGAGSSIRLSEDR
ncbi:P-type conjugative transfer protein TrbL [Roseomonas eburnea]|uniref:P-type conjugative transfer protein TrbL n=1 Tax=Neoroseomonas eburnea TaxID=1346889 RepID=A0A9X9XGQ7_9PROT|nr:P-type conjugative transfer protein TrbL [Neoroseomonas eburnea]MBR0682893.1 P-type conjugative transfer protein TrbL [Neoroseomonas eburnea]